MASQPAIAQTHRRAVSGGRMHAKPRTSIFLEGMACAGLLIGINGKICLVFHLVTFQEGHCLVYFLVHDNIFFDEGDLLAVFVNETFDDR